MCGDLTVERRSYEWFEQRHRTKGLELAHDQISKAFDTVILLHKATKSFSDGNLIETRKFIQTLYVTEEEVDKLRTAVFTELSKGAALVADYREDLLHLVKRLDTLADHVKDAARCLDMLGEAKIPEELCQKTVYMTSKLVEAAQALREGIDKISSHPTEAIAEAKKVEDIEHALDQEYLKAKSLFVKYGNEINCGALVIFDDLIEFIELAADMCADTADYIVIFSSRE
jgi:predicted phosphate transport protein (TIGR00153 family)